MNKKYNIEQTRGPALSFTGHLLGMATSESADKDRWTELFVYKTDKQQVVCVSVGNTVFEHEHKFVKAKAFLFLEDIPKFFGYSNLAKKLYKNLDFKPTLEI